MSPKTRFSAPLLEARNIALLADSSGETVFDFDDWDAHALYIYDPAGNIVEFIARHELRHTASNRPDFALSEIVNVSEIGLASDDVLELAATIKAQSGIETYRDASPTFMPLGDANGLFILVPSGRIWFPETNVPAGIHPVEVTARNAAGARFTIAMP